MSRKCLGLVCPTPNGTRLPRDSPKVLWTRCDMGVSNGNKRPAVMSTQRAATTATICPGPFKGLERRAAVCSIKAMQLDRKAHILVTGSAGRIGRTAVAALSKAGWFVRGFDRVPTPGTSDFVVGNLTDAAALQRAADGASALIHLG